MKKTKIVQKTSDGVTVQISFKFGNSMLETENMIQECLNEAGQIATGEALVQFDADGSPIKIGDQIFYSKGQFEKNYQTPYGEARVLRHVYQSKSGGKTFCPLNHDARVIITSTPKFAKMVSSKYSFGSTEYVKKDLAENHERHVNRKTLQGISEIVAKVALAKETTWEYLPNPKELETVSAVSFGIDGTCMQMRKDGWREAMTGTIALYNKEGERLHTTYLAAPPEYGKETFLNDMKNKMIKTTSLFPKAKTIALADGAKCNWIFFEKLTDYQVLDFYHATGYLGRFAKAVFRKNADQKKWLDDACHKLKHNTGAAVRLFREMEHELECDHSIKSISEIESAATYFSNNAKRMKYKKIRDMKLPIGSGVTEAACKVIVKERMCKSGMRWTNDGARIALKLRSMNQTQGCWDFFWNKVSKNGFDYDALAFTS